MGHKVTLKKVGRAELADELENIEKPQNSNSKAKGKLTITFSAIVISCLMLGTAFGMMISADTPTGFPTVIEPGSQISEYDYIIFQSNGIFYAKNGTTGEIEFSASTSTTVMALVVNALGSEGGIIYDAISHTSIDLRKIHVSRGCSVAYADDSTTPMFSRVGAGQISLIWFTIEGSKYNRLNFTIDGHNCYVDVGTLFLLHYTTLSNFTATHIGGNWKEAGSSGGGFITYPINFKTSFYLNFSADSPASAQGGAIYWQIYYRNLTSNSISTRMAAVPLDWTAYSYGNHTLGVGETITMIDTSGPGRFLGVNMVLKSYAWTFLENDPIMTTDGEILRASGTEDFFLNSEYYQASASEDRGSVGPYVGIVEKNPSLFATSQFRDFLGECGGIPFQSSFIFKWTQDESSLDPIEYSFWVIWETY